MSTKIKYAAFCEDSLRDYLRRERISLNAVRRIRSVRDVEGQSTDTPIFLLPRWFQNPETSEAIRVWINRGGKCVPTSSSGVCEHDTDGDGDCHYCHKTGGCPLRSFMPATLQINPSAPSDPSEPTPLTRPA